jgi:AraC family transcriptional regulator
LLHLHASGHTAMGHRRLDAVVAALARRPEAVAPSAEVLARQAGLSPSRFRVLFRATTGLPLHRWLNRRRLTHARALLLEGGWSVGQAAAAVGFDDQHHFSRLFRQHFGIPPSACRPD